MIGRGREISGGCIAQAWSVAETLRAWHEIAAP
jgi:glycogen debranching enzyme